MRPLSISRSFVRSPSVVSTKCVPKIGTHDGIFHCDEVLGSWIVTQTERFRNAKVIRSRDPEELKQADLVLDVGGVYDPDSLRFDHHHLNFHEVFPGRKIKLSSAGLIYRHFGKEALLTVLHPLELDDYDLDLLYHRIYQHIIEPIDAIDNGISNCKKSDANFVDKTNLITRVGMLNTTWVDRQANRVSDATHHERFLKAMDLCGNDFTTTAQHMARNWLPARKYVKEAIEKRYSVSPTGKLIYLDPSCPWREHLISIEREMSIEGAVQICVHTEGDMFYVQTAPAGMTTFRTRLNLPYSWRGLNGKALDKATEINGCVFVHQLGFIGANKTKEGALAMAERAILLS